MEAIKVNFAGVEGQKSFDPIPTGKYLVEVTDYRDGVASENAKNAGATTISWEFTVRETFPAGETHLTTRSGEEVKVEDRKVWDNMTLVESSFWRLKALLDACGFDVSGEIDFDPDEVVGSEFVAKIGTQPARKNPTTGDEYAARNKIVSFHPLEDADDAPVDTKK